MTRKTLHSAKALKRAIEFHKQEIAKHRDALRSIVEGAEEILVDVDEAVEALQAAIDVISQQL